MRSTPTPRFPTPPIEYRRTYMTDVVRAFSQFAEAVLNPGEGRNTFIVLTDLQQHDVGLEPGAVYRSGNDLKVSLLNVAAPSGGELTLTGGSVSVTIT